VQRLLDGDFALLRNVSKAELLLRLPLCLGVGAVFARLAVLGPRHRGRRRWAPTGVVMGLLVALVLGMAQPAIATKLRTPGWTKVPDYWSQTADYLHRAPGTKRAWVVPGAGFGLQTWGWTMDEPFQAVARSPWVSRSQVPLTPPTTIRTLSTLEHFLETGSGSPALGPALGRLGIGYVLVRHDLDELASDTTTSNLVSIALARSRGVERVALFGHLDFGPAIEVYRVTSDQVSPDLQVRPLSDAVTVAGASSDVIGSVTEGLISPRQPAVVQGDDGWDRPADIVGDSYRDRERNFGRVHNGEGPVRSAGEPYRGKRIVPDYPANTGSRPVRATYDENAFATASSSQAWTNTLGTVQQEAAPYAAFDGDARTAWRSSYADPAQQWLEVRWPARHEIGEVRIRAPVDDGDADVQRWRVSAGGRSVTAAVNPFTGLATADLTGVSGDRLRISVDKVAGGPAGVVSILEVSSDMTPYRRSLVVPDTSVTDHPSFVFTAQPETRACISTLLGPDCNQGRQAVSEESGGLDRTFRVPSAGVWGLTGTVVARSTPGTVSLLDPLGGGVRVRSSSQWLSDPAVSARLAYDGATTTSWIADPRDASPTLTVDFAKPQRIDRLAVTPPASPAVTPISAVIRSAEGTRNVQLGEFGQFAPLRTRHLTITFANPTRGAAPIGISELYLTPAQVATPLQGGDITGAVCGLGPVLFVDGRRYETSVRGFIGDVVSAGPLHYESCSGPVRLGPGTHQFRLGSTEQFQPVTAVLRGAVDVPSGSSRTLGTPSGPVTRQVVRVGPGAASMLSTTRNVNAGWRATLDGRLLPPMMSDGWAQAWRLPAGKGGRVVITYAPQRSYLLALFLGLGVAALVLLGALVLLLRTRLGRPRPLPGWPPPAPRRARWLVGLALALPVAWVLGGLPALAAVAAGAPLLFLERRALLRWIAFGCLVAAYVVASVVLHEGARVRINSADVLAGFGFVLTVASLAPTPRRTAVRAQR
jgi:arabinofuranan 3-O-arabinosyltransferase